jgi:hypothetical protein
MYHPTTRVLTIIELLQAHPSMSGTELAARLLDIAHLQGDQFAAAKRAGKADQQHGFIVCSDKDCDRSG